MSAIAERLLLLRGKKKQGDFAKELGVNPNTLRSYENGRSIPNQEFLEQICVQFSVSAEWLLLGRGPMHPGDASPHDESQNRAPKTAPDPAAPCSRCARLEEKLERMEEERRELSAENRKRAVRIEELLREICELRVQNATLSERQSATLSLDGDFSKAINILSSEPFEKG